MKRVYNTNSLKALARKIQKEVGFEIELDKTKEVFNFKRKNLDLIEAKLDFAVEKTASLIEYLKRYEAVLNILERANFDYELQEKGRLIHSFLILDLKVYLNVNGQHITLKILSSGEINAYAYKEVDEYTDNEEDFSTTDYELILDDYIKKESLVEYLRNL